MDLVSSPLWAALGDGLAGINSGQGQAAPLYQLDASTEAAIAKSSGLKHLKFQPLDSAMAICAARSVLSTGEPARDDRGIITAGGIAHVPVAWAASQSLFSNGPELLNPLQFPHTIPSSLPSVVAAATGSRAFAFAAGHDRTAFFRVLRVAQGFAKLRLARQVIAIATLHANPILTTAAEAMRLQHKLANVALALKLSVDSPVNSLSESLRLLGMLGPAKRLSQILRHSQARFDVPQQYCFWIDRSHNVRANFDTALLHADAWTASGAVAIFDALSLLRHKGSNCRFCVAVQCSRSAAGAVFELTCNGEGEQQRHSM